MSKKAFFIILVLSVVVTIGTLFIQFGLSMEGPHYGFPLSFTTLSFFGASSTNYLNLLLDVIFWFLLTWVLWRVLQKVTGK